MASEILGLFTSPQQYQQQQQDVVRARALEFARLSPFEQANAAIGQGAYGLAGAIGGALGGVDPQLQKITQRQQLASQLDPSNPQSYMQVAKIAADAGDQQFAMAIADAGRQAAIQVAQANKERQATIPARIQESQQAAAITQAIDAYKAMPQTPEIQNAIKTLEVQLDFLSPKPKAEATPNEIQIATRFALRKGPEGSPEFNTEFDTQLTRLTTKEPKTQAKEEIFDLVDKLKTLDPVKDKFEYDTLKARIEKLTNKGKSIEETIGEGFGILGKALAAGQKKESEATGTFSAENFKNLGSAVASSTSSKRNIATLENALTNAFTGKFSEGKEAAVASLIALGFPVGDDLKKATSNTQLIQAMGTRYIFPLVKNYPGSLAAKELASLEKTAPNALQQPETIQRLVNLLKDDLSENEYTYNAAKTYKQQNKNSLIGFNDADAKIEFQNKLNTLKDLVDRVRRKKSKTQVEDAEIQRLRKELYIGG
jgi:hypothetical protein